MILLFFFCSLILASGGRYTHDSAVRYELDNDVDENSNLYFRGNEGEKTKSSQLDEITEKDLPKNGELFEGDMVMDDGMRAAVLQSSSGNHERAAIWIAEDGGTRHWEDGIVPYEIGDVLEVIAQKIPTAIAIFNHFTCIKFIPRKPWHKDYFKFVNGKGCSSSVGRKGGMQTVHLGHGCKRLGTIMHEMMHVLGIIHEQSRPDRDQYLKINFANLKKGVAANFQKYSRDQADTLDTPYNYYSVMHYSNYAFSKNDEVTLQSKFDADLDFGQRKMISHLDAQEINRLYPCNKSFDNKSQRCMNMPCEGMRRCCLYDDETAKDVMDELRRRKDFERKNADSWEKVWRDLLLDYEGEQ